MAQSLALLRQWLKLLDYETSEVLWRAAHARGMPCADAAAGGRTIAQTAAAVPPPLRTNWTRRVSHPVLIGHAASLSQVAEAQSLEQARSSSFAGAPPARPPPARLPAACARA